MGSGLLVVALWKGRKMKLEVMEKATNKERWIAFKDAIWGLMMPVIILGGIYGGYLHQQNLPLLLLSMAYL